MLKHSLPANLCVEIGDFAISNVQCQYDSGSEMDPYLEPREEPTEDHTYGVRNFEPPAFFIQQMNHMQAGKIAIPRSFENPLPSRPKLPELRPKIMTIGPMYPSVNVIDVRDQPPANTRIRRSEVVLRQAADCVSRGLTFQTVSEQFNIPISTIRFFMARKGILPRRRRGRTTHLVPPSVSPEPPYHMQHFKLPPIVGLKTEADDSNEPTT